MTLFKLQIKYFFSMQRTLECGPLLKNVMNQTVPKIACLKANINGILQEEVANFILHCSFHVIQMIIAALS